MEEENLKNMEKEVNNVTAEEVNVVQEETSKMSKKDEFSSILDKIQEMEDAIELHNSVKEALSNEEVDTNYLKYIENSIEDKIFCDAKFDKISPKVLIEIICPELKKFEKSEKFDITKLEITDIGSHYEEQVNYLDKVCTYDGKLVCIFGVEENNVENFVKYESRKFVRQEILESVKAKVEPGKVVQMEQYDNYYVIQDEISVKIYKEKQVTALTQVKETPFDKIKAKLLDFFKKLNSRNKAIYPIIELIYDSNPNRFKDMKHHSKVDAKNRMKILLDKERLITRETVK